MLIIKTKKTSYEIPLRTINIGSVYLVKIVLINILICFYKFHIQSTWEKNSTYQKFLVIKILTLLLIFIFFKYINFVNIEINKK